MKPYIITILLSLNFFLNINSQAPYWAWARADGALENLGGSCLDKSGNFYVSGISYSSTLSIGNFTFNNAGQPSIYIAKYNATGSVVSLWNTPVNGTLNVKSIKVDGNGNIFVAGSYFSPTLTLSTYTISNFDVLNGTPDSYIIKYNSIGAISWVKTINGGDYEDISEICTDIQGNVFVTGLFTSQTLSIGTSTYSNAGTDNFFLVKYSSSGSISWSRVIGGYGNDQSHCLATDNLGNVFLAGCYDSPLMTFGTHTVSNVGQADIFIAKYDATGNALWAISAGDAVEVHLDKISTDINGNFFITGYFFVPTFTLGNVVLTNHTTTNSDIYIAKYNSSGNVIWAKSFGGSDDDMGIGICNDNLGNTYFAGLFKSSSITLGGVTIHSTNPNLSDVFIARVNLNGNVDWVRNPSGMVLNANISSDAGGNIYTSTLNFLPCTFGPYTLQNGAFYVAKLGNNLVNLAEVKNSIKVKVFPNPVKDIVQIENPSEGYIQKISIFNQCGEVVYSKTIDKFEGSQALMGDKLRLDLEFLQEGIYLLHFEGQSINQSVKLLKE